MNHKHPSEVDSVAIGSLQVRKLGCQEVTELLKDTAYKVTMQDLNPGVSGPTVHVGTPAVPI